MLKYYLIFIFLLIQNDFSFVNSYNFAIPLVKRCDNIPCGSSEDEIHTLCRKDEVSRTCVAFSQMPLNKKFILLGHNGIRNKIAANWKIRNFNLLHWSRDLEVMATMFIKRCQLTPDICDFIGDKSLTVGQNLYVSQKPPNNIHNYEQTYSLVIREWYRELGPNIKTLNQYKASTRRLDHFTNMIWPTTEFVGCSGARMFHGYAVACYYHPAADRTKYDLFEAGRPCSLCSVDRPTCSLDFHSLCGLDYPNNFDGVNDLLRPDPFIILILLFFLVFIR